MSNSRRFGRSSSLSRLVFENFLRADGSWQTIPAPEPEEEPAPDLEVIAHPQVIFTLRNTFLPDPLHRLRLTEDVWLDSNYLYLVDRASTRRMELRLEDAQSRESLLMQLSSAFAELCPRTPRVPPEVMERFTKETAEKKVKYEEQLVTSLSALALELAS